MSRRITIYDYPEHLNPFYEELKVERKPDIKKYGTWGATNRSRIRKSIADSTWLEALNLSPAKKQVSKKWAFIKTHTVEKLLRGRLNTPTCTTQRPQQRDVIHIRPQRLFSERLPSTSTPYKDYRNDWSPEKVEQIEKEADDEPQVVVPKMRKKRAAPRPPSSMLNSDPEKSIDMETWNSIEPSVQHAEKETTQFETEMIACSQINCEMKEVVVDVDDDQISSPMKETSVTIHSHNITA